MGNAESIGGLKASRDDDEEENRAMHPYDVHAFCTIRVKIPGVMAESPEQAIAKAMEDEGVTTDIARIVDHEDMTGPVETIEFQDGDVPTAHQVDEADAERRVANPSGWSYRTDVDGRPVRVRHLMPTAFQDAVIEAFGGTRLIVAEDDIEAAASRLRRRGHDEASVLMRRLGSMSDRTEAVRTVQDMRDALDRVVENLGRCDPDLELAPEYRER